MLITFQIILCFILLISFMGTVAEKESDKQKTLGAVTIASIGALFVTFLI
jgi:hypothetical protein